MAMRGRGGRGNLSRPRLITNRVYDKFKPMSEWRQEDDHDTLLLYLPGFQKEYIKVTTEDSNIVRVRGERLVSENKWSRFQEDYRVPENCEMKGIRAKLDGGILTITMPRKTTDAPPPPLLPPNTTTSRVAAKTEEEAVRRTKQEEPKETKPDKPITTRLEDKTLPLPLPPPVATPTQVAAKTEEPVRRTKQEEPKEKKPDKPQTTRLEDYTLPPPPKPRSSSSPTKQQPSKPAPPAKEAMEFTTRTSPRGGIEHDAKKPGVGEKTYLDKGKEKVTTLIEETKREFERKREYAGVVSGGFQADLNKVIASRGIVNEDRKLLVNVGVGVLIIAALGVHVSYTMGLIGKGK